MQQAKLLLLQAAGLKSFPDKPAHLPDDLAKYKFAKQNWAHNSGKGSNAEYVDWLLSSQVPGLFGSEPGTAVAVTS